MPQDSARPINPATEEFAGDSLGRSLKRAFHATRPKFFPASVLPVVAGTAWGAYATAQFDLYVFVLALVATVSLSAFGCDIKRSMQHLNSTTREGGVADGLSKEDLLHRS